MHEHDSNDIDLNPAGFEPPKEANVHLCAAHIEPHSNGSAREIPGGILTVLLHAIVLDGDRPLGDAVTMVDYSLN